MTKEYILQNIDRIETAIFMIDMIDRWTDKNRKDHQALCSELRYWRAELKKVEG